MLKQMRLENYMEKEHKNMRARKTCFPYRKMGVMGGGRSNEINGAILRIPWMNLRWKHYVHC